MSRSLIKCVSCVRERPRPASHDPLYLRRVLERDWCLLKLWRPARWPLMGTVLILSKCTLLLLWAGPRGRAGRSKKKWEQEKIRVKEGNNSWRSTGPESKISKGYQYPNKFLMSIWARKCFRHVLVTHTCKAKLSTQTPCEQASRHWFFRFGLSWRMEPLEWGILNPSAQESHAHSYYISGQNNLSR